MAIFAVDRNSNSIYLVEGFNPSGATVIKINSAATLLATYAGNPNFFGDVADCV